MTPSELKNSLLRMQMCSVALMLSLAKHNKDLAALAASIDNENEFDFIDSVAALGTSSKMVADTLGEYCDSSAFLIGGNWFGQG